MSNFVISSVAADALAPLGALEGICRHSADEVQVLYI